jgi:hypothetical protein
VERNPDLQRIKKPTVSEPHQQPTREHTRKRNQPTISGKQHQCRRCCRNTSKSIKNLSAKHVLNVCTTIIACTRPDAVVKLLPLSHDNVRHHATHKPTTTSSFSLHATHQFRILNTFIRRRFGAIVSAIPKKNIKLAPERKNGTGTYVRDTYMLLFSTNTNKSEEGAGKRPAGTSTVKAHISNKSI